MLYNNWHLHHRWWWCPSTPHSRGQMSQRTEIGPRSTAHCWGHCSFSDQQLETCSRHWSRSSSHEDDSRNHPDRHFSHFFKVPVMQGLADAVFGVFSVTPTIVYAHLPRIPQPAQWLSEGIKPLDNQTHILSCYKAFKQFVIWYSFDVLSQCVLQCWPAL